MFALAQFDDKQRDLQRAGEDAQIEFEQEQQRTFAGISQKMQNVINKYAIDNNFALITSDPPQLAGIPFESFDRPAVSQAGGLLPRMIRMYCSGVKMKNTQNSVRWSPRRVGVIEMNSRSAQNEIIANSSTVSHGAMNANKMTMLKNHQD